MAVTEYVTAISWKPTRVACVDACHNRMIDGERSDVSPTGRRLLYVLLFFLYSVSRAVTYYYYYIHVNRELSNCRDGLCYFFAPFHFLYELFGKCSNPTGRSFDKLRQQRMRLPPVRHRVGTSTHLSTLLCGI